jgi:uncharacterized membrane protein YqjE
MTAYDRNIRNPQAARHDGRFDVQDEDDARLGDLLRRFTQDAAALVRHEIALAKLEVRENIKGYARDAAKIGVAAAVGLLGLCALVAFAIAGLGDLIDNYWLGALIVAVLLLATAGVMARAGLAHMRRNSVAPEETVATLKEDKQWVKHEARDLKQKLKA